MIKQSRPTTAIPTGVQDQQLRELVGSNLSQFQIMNELGKGSYGTVYKVKSTLDQGIYVLKKINLTHLKSKQSAEALKEAQLLRKLKHPNIISYFVSFIEQDHLCIVMEYADGGDLQKLLKDYKERRKYLPEEMIWEMAKELSSALQHIHENNIIHRDIKTLNVFLTRDKKIKLGDLGVSKIFNSDIALQGTRVGTPLYLAPELVQHHPYDYKVDIWALGCVIFHMAALEPPFHGDNLISLGYNIVNKAPKGLPPQYSPRLTQFIWKLLEKMPTLRPSIIEINNSYFQQQRQIQQRQEFPQRPQTSHVRSNAIQQDTEKMKKTQRKFNESVNFDNTQKQQELLSEDRVFSRNLQIQQQIQQQQQKLEQERIEKERIEKERLEKIEKERLERERLEKERQEREREKDRLERERLERIERERIEREKQEQERIERERRDKEQKQLQKEQIALELKPQLQEQKNMIRIQQQNIELYIQEIDEKRELTLDQVKLNSKSRYIKGPATIRPLSAQTRGGSFANLVNCRARNILPTSQHQSVKEVKKFTIFDIKGYQSEEQRDIQQQPYIEQPYIQDDRKEGESQSQPPIQQVQYKPKENNVRIKSAVLLINQRKSNDMKNSNHIVKHYTLKDIID